MTRRKTVKEQLSTVSISNWRCVKWTEAEKRGYSNAIFETLLGMRGSREWGVC